ncbi:MAG: hypothetical protein HUK02_08265, partial [Bacteroidaceae bacterium]|nr:hypothetical protein [Bacteroidaceae bacterium]
MKKTFLLFCLATASVAFAQQVTYPVPVSEAQEPMATGEFEPTWESLRT